MKLKSRHRPDPSFNMSSMTDVVFLLLVFFIMTSKVMPSGMQVNLPKSDINDPVKVMRVSVSIMANGELYVDQDKVTLDNLLGEVDRRLSPKSEDKYKNVIVVKGDKDVSYGDVINVTTVCRKIENATVTLQLEQN